MQTDHVPGSALQRLLDIDRRSQFLPVDGHDAIAD